MNVVMALEWSFSVIKKLFTSRSECSHNNGLHLDKSDA